MNSETNTASEKSIVLKPSWKQYFVQYLLSVLAVPLFGIGLAALYFVRKKHLSQTFEVTDSRIASTGSKNRRNIELTDIDKIVIRKSWLQEKFGIGTLVLETSAYEMIMPGMRQPQTLKSTIEKAIAVQKKRSEKQSFRERPDPDFKPGAMEKMDYLTGLWHQGLLSDDDFKKEKKNFE